MPLRAGAMTLADALKVGAEAAASRGRMVISVLADGVQIPEEVLASPAESLGTWSKLELQSADPRELVASSLLDAAGVLQGVVRDQQSLAEQIHAGRTSESVDTLRGILAAWGAVREVVSRGGAVLNIDLTATPLDDDGGTLADSVVVLREHLRAVKDAMENEDWSALADVVSMDLDADAQTWASSLRLLAQRTRAGGAAR